MSGQTPPMRVAPAPEASERGRPVRMAPARVVPGRVCGAGAAAIAGPGWRYGCCGRRRRALLGARGGPRDSGP